MPKAIDLRTECGNRPTLWVWEGSDDPIDIPRGGDVSYMDRYNGMRNLSEINVGGWQGEINAALFADHPAKYVQVPATMWGDYAGSTVQRSNARSIARDYPDLCVTVSGDYSSEVLLLPADTELSDDLFRALVSLADEYPLWDESDYSELEWELADECWDSYGRADWISEVRDEIIRLVDDYDEWANTLTVLDSPEIVDAVFHDYQQNGTVDYPVFEDAVSCYWPGSVDAAKDYAATLIGGV